MPKVIPGYGLSSPPVPAYGRHLHADVRQLIEEVVQSVPVDYGGGSGSGKALVIADLIAQFGVRDTIEIGVYRGRSLLPVATMLKIAGAGVATGIDPWVADEALQEDTHAVGPEVNEWVRSHPWDDTYQSVVDRIEQYSLTEHCRILRMTSEAAAPQIPDASVGLVHVDGNHDRAAVEQDVELYLPKLKPGGFLVLDDASWDSVRPVIEELRGRLEYVFQIGDFLNLHEAQPNDFVILRTPA
jgi:Methyltransferase domain